MELRVSWAVPASRRFLHGTPDHGNATRIVWVSGWAGMLLASRDILCAAAASVSAVAGAVFDVQSRRIPNRLTAGSLLGGLGLHLYLGGMAGLGASALDGVLAGGAFLLVYLAGGMGAGDVKLMAAVGALASPSGLWTMLLATVCLGALFAVAVALYHRRLQQTVVRALALSGWPPGASLDEGRDEGRGEGRGGSADENGDGSLRMPFALPIAGGCLFVLSMQIVSIHLGRG